MNELGTKNVPFFFMIDFKKEHGEVIPLSDLDSNIHFSLENLSSNEHAPNFSLSKTPITEKEYQEQFKQIHQHLLRGNSYLTNLTCKTPIEVDLTLDEIYTYAQAKYKLLYYNQFVCFSPERFIKIENGIISTNPMKGTIDASIPNAEASILSNAKESAEHATIVDLLRNDLSIVASNVHVTNYRYIEHIQTNEQTLLQVSSEIQGELTEDYHHRLGDIFNALLPAGSICGAPKQKTMEIIEQVESYKRNFYTGVFGVYDGKNLDSAVMIRFIEQEDDKLFFKSGGGITAKSICQDEYLEMIQKVYVPIY